MGKNLFFTVFLFGLLTLGAVSCRKRAPEEKDGFMVNLLFRPSPTLSQSISSRFRVSLFTDGTQTMVKDIESVKLMNEGLSFNVVRGENFELSAVYGWPYGMEWYNNGSLIIPYGQMMPQAGGAYICEAFPSDKDAKTPFELSFEKLYYEFPVIIEGEKGVTYVMAFDCEVCGFGWPDLSPVSGTYHYELSINGAGHDTVRIPAIADSSIMDVSLTCYDADGGRVYGPERWMETGAVVGGKDGNVFSILWRNEDKK